ncbi:hypothetical protein D3C87_1935000 [compost metagenome]
MGQVGVVDVVHVDRHRRGVVEGTQHATHIFIRTVFTPTLVQRPRRLAFEVDQVRIALDHQDLTEVQVAVDPDPQAAGGLFAQLLDVAEHGFFVVQ